MFWRRWEECCGLFVPRPARRARSQYALTLLPSRLGVESFMLLRAITPHRHVEIRPQARKPPSGLLYTLKRAQAGRP